MPQVVVFIKSIKSKAAGAEVEALDFASIACRPPNFCLRPRFLSAPARVCSEDDDAAVEGAGLGVAVVPFVLVVEGLATGAMVGTATGATLCLLWMADFEVFDRLAGGCVSDLKVFFP